MPGLPALGQTIQVVDRSGKVVRTSRHLFDVFKIGRDAYNESKRKAKSKRVQEASRSRPSRAYTLDDLGSVRSGRSHRSHDGYSRSRRHIESPRSPNGEWNGEDMAGGVPFYEAYPQFAPEIQQQRRHSEFHSRPEHAPAPIEQMNGHTTVPPQPQWQYPPEPYHNRSVYQPQRGPPFSPPQDFEAPVMIRRSTAKPALNVEEIRKNEGIDLDLAYGEIPPDCLYPGSPSVASTPEQDEKELTGLIGKANFLLEEANCLKSGATATITHLQKNPDAMAAVGLTLAEISNLLKRMSPKVLANLRTAAPAVFSLLAHPQFLIAAGVATGVTIIAFGGYKIIKRIQQRREMESMGDEGMLPVEEVSRIESWRRGIADAEAASVGTSVDGEIITPLAANLSRMNLAEEQRERELRRAKSERERERERELKRRSTTNGERERKPRSKAPRSVTSSRTARSRRTVRSSSEPRAPKSGMDGPSASKSAKSGTAKRAKTVKKQEAKPSPLRRLLLT